MNDRPNALELSGIKKSYQSGGATIEVLCGASLTLKPGEIVALEAPSGAGKSTLLHICGLLESCDTGVLRVHGRDVSGLSDAARTTARRDEIGFIYQFHHLLPEFSALENVMLPQLAAGASETQARARAHDLLTRLGLGARLNHRPATLSGGEQQRTAFCRALANKPGLLLADEPTGNLDPTTSLTVFEALIAMARDTGLTALVATHNPELAARMDRRLRLDQGLITAQE